MKSQTVIKWFFLLGLFLLPFVFWPFATIPFEIPRVWFVQRWIEGLGALGLLVGIWGLIPKRTDSKLILLVIVFVFTAFISSSFGVDFGKSFWGNPYRGDGLFTLFHLAGFFFFLILFWRPSWQRPTVVAISTGSILISLLSLFLTMRLYILGDASIPNWDGAIGGTFGQPKFLAGYLLVTLPFLAYLGNRRVLFLQSCAIIFTFAASAALGILLFWAGWLFLGKGRIVRRVLIPVVLILAITVGIFLVWQNKPKFPLNSTSTEFTVHPQSRERIIVKGINGFLQKPVLGWGFANFDYAFNSTVWPLKLGKLGNDVYVDKAHSTFLEALVTTGAIGLGSYLLIIGWVFWRLVKNRNKDKKWYKALFLVFLLYIFHAQTNVISIGEELFFWLVLGIVGSEATEPG